MCPPNSQTSQPCDPEPGGHHCGQGLRLCFGGWRIPKLHGVALGKQAFVKRFFDERHNINTNCYYVSFWGATSIHLGTFDFILKLLSSFKNLNKSMFSSSLKRVIYLFKVIIKFQHNPSVPGGKDTLWTIYFSHPWSARENKQLLWRCLGAHCHGNGHSLLGH